MLFISCTACQIDAEPDAFRDGGPPIGVFDQDAEFIGWLASPSADQILHHDNVFQEPLNGSPAIIHLTTPEQGGEYGLHLASTGPSFNVYGNGPVRYTMAGCQGTAHHLFATYQDGSWLTPADCAFPESPTLQGQLIMNFPYAADFDALVETDWPGAEGAITPIGQDLYLLPRDQAWPEMLKTASVRTANGCFNLVKSVQTCSVRVLETSWEPGRWEQPHSLVEVQP